MKKERKNIKKFPGFPEKPDKNYWQYPRILDEWWHLLKGSDQKVLDYMLRHSWGFQKYEGDKIALSQFVKGIKKKSGKQLDYGTGLSRPTVISALKRLEKKGLCKGVKSKGKTTFWRLKVVKNNYHSNKKILPVASKENLLTINNVTIDNRQYNVNIYKILHLYYQLKGEKILPSNRKAGSFQRNAQLLAKMLQKHPSEDIKMTMNWLAKERPPNMWTLETVSKELERQEERDKAFEANYPKLSENIRNK